MGIKFIKTTNIGGYKSETADSSLSGFKKLNIFIGKNNSGKSRFLRHLILNRKSLISNSAQDTFEVVEKAYLHLKQAYPEVAHDSAFLIVEFGSIIGAKSQDIFEKLSEFHGRVNNIVSSNGDTVRGTASRQNIARIISSSLSKIDFSETNNTKEILYAYIPILRGLRPLVRDKNKDEEAYVSEDCYSSRTQYDYFKGFSESNVLIFSGLNLYQEISDMLLGDKESRDFVKDFESFLSKHFFKNEEVTLIPKKKEDVLSIRIGNDERSVHNLGDGIQSILCTTFLAFKNKDKNLILFIEEPEVYLHPGMQRTLVEVLVTELEHVQVFLTTHSNHFLDLTFDYETDVSIFSFEKNSLDFYIKNVTDHREIINVLGIRNSSVFLSNCVIWVEGVSDRIYLKKFLQMYLKYKNIEFKEDYHFAFSEYGGSNIENFEFIDSGERDESKVKVESISLNNLIIADNDGYKIPELKNSEKAKRLKKLKTLLGDSFYDNYIEVENLVPFSIYNIVLEKLLDDSTKKQIKIRKSLLDNSEVHFNNELEKEKIGILLKRYFIEPRTEKYPDYIKSNSIECLGETKKVIAELVVKEIDTSGITFQDLPKSAKKVTEAVVAFIESRNATQPK